MKPLIVLGDKTNHGGTVVTADAGFTQDGIAVAGHGDMVVCPILGHTPSTIIASGCGFTLNGKQAAHDGDQTSCGAKLIASHFTVKHG
ncbi:PAAR domain-containing protein [Hafnia paralvei]|uniref:PAAR domain-containing protein n=1 Tax=Hafnia paralvei TaxID=546367 RepID=UPI0029D8DCFB|nr:PAAR domain-containing protein [Hafnia paralvei]MDX6841608.1 PAAR domain-containing protein [Hafnia paralvei]